MITQDKLEPGKEYLVSVDKGKSYQRWRYDGPYMNTDITDGVLRLLPGFSQVGIGNLMLGVDHSAIFAEIPGEVLDREGVPEDNMKWTPEQMAYIERETLSQYAHEAWSGWMEYLSSNVLIMMMVP